MMMKVCIKGPINMYELLFCQKVNPRSAFEFITTTTPSNKLNPIT